MCVTKAGECIRKGSDQKTLLKMSKTLRILALNGAASVEQCSCAEDALGSGLRQSLSYHSDFLGASIRVHLRSCCCPSLGEVECRRSSSMVAINDALAVCQ